MTVEGAAARGAVVRPAISVSAGVTTQILPVSALVITDHPPDKRICCDLCRT